MTDLPISRDNVRAWYGTDDKLHLEVTIGPKTFQGTADADGPKMPMIETLWEHLCHNVIGITKHDLMMVVHHVGEKNA